MWASLSTFFFAPSLGQIPQPVILHINIVSPTFEEMTGTLELVSELLSLCHYDKAYQCPKY